MNDLTEKIGRIIAEKHRALASGKLGSQAWWRKLEQLTMHKDKSSSSLDQQFINGLNDYIGDLCLDRKYIKPVPAEIDINTPVPQLSTAQVFQALSQILKAYCYGT